MNVCMMVWYLRLSLEDSYLVFVGSFLHIDFVKYTFAWVEGSVSRGC